MKGVLYDGIDLQVVDDLSIREPGPDEVKVRIKAAGVCHSDISVIDGTIPFPTPVVLGHEGAGVVEAVGSSVFHVAPGDHVSLSTLTNCGTCAECGKGRPTMCRKTFGGRSAPFTWRGEPAYSYANAGVFSEYTVVKGNQAVPIPRDVPLEAAALIGCSVLTGVGAALNRAQVSYGDTAVVIGIGGIGLNVLQGCRIAGASRIVAVDTNPGRAEIAKQFGATDFIDSRGKNVVDAVKEVLPTGADHVFECVGNPTLIRAAIDLLDWHGQCVMVGVPPATAALMS
ncbi:alcohol dehydrogenase catalytic domain-containing protein, partial [Streptomyces sp. NPDC005373]|uniref:alcohol dehydrogenase catalytic domain-containing protein n=1 Tax=Streptomyces sp. NPDC005373 TaxID=3156879 RepID=UPI0033B7BDBC